MVDWTSTEVRELCGFLFRILVLFAAGFFVWYYIHTLPRVELALITGKMRFTYAHISYLSARHLQLAALLTIAITTNADTVVLYCGGAVTLKVTAALGSLALVSSSTNLALRAVAMWKDVKPVMTGIILVCVAHAGFALIMGLFSIQNHWDPKHNICSVTEATGQVELLAFYAVTLAWDMIILLFTIFGMRRQHLSSNSTLWATLRSQGALYAILSSAACVPMMVMLALNLNNLLNVIFTAPGGTVCVIASSAFVRSLFEMKQSHHTLSATASLSPTNHYREGTLRDDGNVSRALSTHVDIYESEFWDSSEVLDGRTLARKDEYSDTV